MSADRSVNRKLNLKRKYYCHGKGGTKMYKKFKRMPKFARDNIENKIAKQKERDAYHFSDSDDDGADDLGMGLELSDLPFLLDAQEEQEKKMIALTQDSVQPLFANESQVDESKFEEALIELKYSSFRPNQKETIKRILMGRSTLFISPTGSGKSLCYQMPALLYWRYKKYITIVVSPLISLMEDQMNNFPSELRAVSLHSNHNITQRRRSFQQLVNGEAQVAFISPEAIVGGLLNLEDLKTLPPVGFVCIDEAHCLSEWSHNFRPAYLQFFNILHDNMKIKTYLGLTATATSATSFAIAKSLVINPEKDVVGSTRIPDNLILSVSHESNKEAALITLLKSPTFRIMTSIIVYCNRREETERIASRIRTSMQDYKTLVEVPERRKSTDSNDSNSSEKSQMKLPWNAEPYHAGLSNDTRKNIQREFIKGNIRVIVATVAFGMGINKSNIRAIIHYDMPSSFESYVQEIGRAGRDGKIAQCHMFLRADKADLYYQQRNIYNSVTDTKYLKKLTEYIFRKCSCDFGNGSNTKLDNLNKLDPHIIKSEHQTKFIATPVTPNTEEDSDDEDILHSKSLDYDDNSKENKSSSPVKFIRRSIVRKHRCCTVLHEKTFSIQEATENINLKIESIITLICQLQKAYPQLQISQYPPVKSTCNLVCYKGPDQLETIAKNNKIINTALMFHRLKQKKTHGTIGERPSKLTFEVAEVASPAGYTYSEAVKILQRAEWEMVEQTGRFKRSNVKVKFDGYSFHIKSVGDLNDKEMEEVNNFLIDFMQLYEKIEREKLTRVFETFKTHSIDVNKQMSDKHTRLKKSSDLKEALNSYFDRNRTFEVSDDSTKTTNQLTENDELNKDSTQDCRLRAAAREIRERGVTKLANEFLSTPNKGYFTPLSIAKIFQGISTPKHPAEIWGTNKKFWRAYTDLDFRLIVDIIKKQMIARCL